MRYKFRLLPLLAWAVAIVLVGGLVAVTAFADDLGPPVGTKAFAKMRDRRTSTTST